MSACVEPGALSGISSRRVLETRVHVTDCRTAAEQILAWARAGRPGYVCAATVHMLMEAHDTPEFRRVLEEASLVTADGMPVAWALRLLGTPGAQRVCGPDLMQELCALAARTEVPIGLYG
ncbi:MAG: WecB/TagA/CpsF family glycosyltransferase, partial [Candidatus Wallbacteria bacterium]|nr:WecB/TagA/CpsF family glycosyltransferase [Candidatus Wallbacteria bacterium]